MATCCLPCPWSTCSVWNRVIQQATEIPANEFDIWIQCLTCIMDCDYLTIFTWNFHLSRPPCLNYKYYTLIIALGITTPHPGTYTQFFLKHAMFDSYHGLWSSDDFDMKFHLSLPSLCFNYNYTLSCIWHYYLLLLLILHWIMQGITMNEFCSEVMYNC
jgi:hypothetical protein